VKDSCGYIGANTGAYFSAIFTSRDSQAEIEDKCRLKCIPHQSQSADTVSHPTSDLVTLVSVENPLLGEKWTDLNTWVELKFIRNN
jgi:hypothetical protein